MNTRELLRGFTLALVLLMHSEVQAGQNCDTTPAEPWRTTRGLTMAGQLNATLNSRSDRVALIARVGSDVSRYGLRYTHAALAYRTAPGAPWTVLHKLNTCGTDQGKLYRQGLGNFFLDTPYEYRAMVVWLKPDIADKVLAAVTNESHIRAIDQPRYSLLAYPYGTSTQNSNGWLIEFLASATAPQPIHSRSDAQRRLRNTHFDPDVIHVGTGERLGASFGRANVSFLDHPLRHRLAGDYETVTVESLVRWLDRQGWIAAQTEIGD
ncbi:MAG: DUF2145 domain-containing protein [Pseudomonadota bacterium]